MTITKMMPMEMQQSLTAADAANFIGVVMDRIIKTTGPDDSPTDRQIRFATAVQIYHHELHGVPTTMAEIQKTVAVTINFLRQRLNKLVETDILQITKLPAAGKTTNFTNHYSLSDSIIAETVALRRRG